MIISQYLFGQAERFQTYLCKEYSTPAGGLNMSRKRKILDCLTREYLLEIASNHEISGVARLKKEDLVRTLSRKQLVNIELILNDLSLADLKIICQGMGIDDTGRKKSFIIDRLLNREDNKRKKTKKDLKVKLPPEKK